MNILLDTCTFLWLCIDEDSVSKTAMSTFKKASSVYLSSVSVWEMSQKRMRGMLNFPVETYEFIATQRSLHTILPLSLDEQSAARFESLPMIHKDPADRLLICQALENNLAILTPDPYIQKYDVKTIW